MNDTPHDARATRREDGRFTAGHGEYTNDLARPGALHAVFVRSPHPSASVRSIDTTAALAREDVVAVLTGADLAADDLVDGATPFKFPQGDGSFALKTPRPLLARERVPFEGGPVALVLARTWGRR